MKQVLVSKKFVIIHSSLFGTCYFLFSVVGGFTSMAFSLNRAELSLNSSEFRESEKSLKHELGSIWLSSLLAVCLWHSGRVSVSHTGDSGFEPSNFFKIIIFLSLNSLNPVKTFRENSIGVLPTWNRSLNAANSGNRTKHWSMIWGQFKDPHYPCLGGCVVRLCSAKQYVASSKFDKNWFLSMNSTKWENWIVFMFFLVSVNFPLHLF